MEPIAAPPNRPVTAGLLAAATRVDPPNGRWAGGFGVEHESCDGPGLIPLGCAPVEDDKPLGTNPGPIAYTPALILTGESCSTMSNRSADAQADRSERHLRAVESAGLERLLWTGQDSAEDLTPARPYLASPAAEQIADGTALGLAHGLAVLDQALTACMNGATGLVHVTPYTAARLVQIGAIERDATGARLITPNGHTVVAGAGYTGQGPRPADGAELPTAPDLTAEVAPDQWAYATGPAFYLLGEVQALPSTDHRSNDAVAYAERPAAAWWVCCHFGVNLDMTPA